MCSFDNIRNAILGKAEASPAPAPPVAVLSPSMVDMGAILDQAVAKKPQMLDWRHSIVDLSKALDLDSSPAAHKELATELNYPGDMDDSATMNMWLHRTLMHKLVESGGKVPAELTAR